MTPVFHLSLPCLDIEKTRKFYIEKLGLKRGRETSKWLDIDLFNNQLTYVLVDKFSFDFPNYAFEREILPAFHFGIVLDADNWEIMHNKVDNWSTDKVIVKTFLKDKKGEHQSFFVKEPNGYTIEFKMFMKQDEIFI